MIFNLINRHNIIIETFLIDEFTEVNEILNESEYSNNIITNISFELKENCTLSSLFYNKGFKKSVILINAQIQ